MDAEPVRHSIPPVFDEKSRTLILGTMPSPASRSAGFYYSHPQNRFWPVLAAVFNSPLPVSTEEKRQFALSHGIALWDVLASCHMRGAYDASISLPEPNNIAFLLQLCPIERIFTTGQRAAQLYKKLCLPQTQREAIALPSTSSANQGRWPLPRLIEAYGIIRQ